MKSDMDKLRAALMRERHVDRKDRRRIRYLSPERQAHNDKIIEVMQDLRCDRGWKLSGRMVGCGEIDEHDNMHYCQIPHCSRCSMVRRGKETRKAIQQSFLDVPNERLAFVTILLPVAPMINAVGAQMDAEKRRLINMLGRLRRDDNRWNGVHITGYWEVDRISPFDQLTLSQRKQRALDELGAPCFANDDSTLWLPHLHAIVDLGDVSIDELRKALKGDGRRTAYQLHVQAFRLDRTPPQNLKRIIRYCLKFRLEDGFKKGYGLDIVDQEEVASQPSSTREWWPDHDIVDAVDWAKTIRGGFRSLRFEIGRAGEARKAHAAAVSSYQKERKKVSKKRQEALDNDQGNSICDDVSELDQQDMMEALSITEELCESTDHVDVSMSGYDPIRMCHGLGRNKEPLHDTNWFDYQNEPTMGGQPSGADPLMIPPARINDIEGPSSFAAGLMAASAAPVDAHTEPFGVWGTLCSMSPEERAADASMARRMIANDPTICLACEKEPVKFPAVLCGSCATAPAGEKAQRKFVRKQNRRKASVSNVTSGLPSLVKRR